MIDRFRTTRKGGKDMATSSIFRNIVLRTEEDVDSFIRAVEASQNDQTESDTPDMHYLEDDKALDTFLEKVVRVNV